MFEQLALPHADGLYRLARRLTRDEHSALDLVQETYLRAYNSFSGFEMRQFGIRPWLVRIMHNAFLNRVAREAREPRACDSARFERVAADPVAAADATGAKLGEMDYDCVDEEVKRAIDRLPLDFRTVLLLWATMEFSYAEISRTLSIPVGTVMSRLHRARCQLAESLREYARARRLNRSDGRS